MKKYEYETKFIESYYQDTGEITHDVKKFLKSEEFETGEWELININYLKNKKGYFDGACIHYKKNLYFGREVLDTASNSTYNKSTGTSTGVINTCTGVSSEEFQKYKNELQQKNVSLPKYDTQQSSLITEDIKETHLSHLELLALYFKVKNERDFYKKMCTMLNINVNGKGYDDLK